MITFGIILSTYASSQSLHKQKQENNDQKDELQPDFIRWTIGISMLIFALLLSALMGLYQEKLYSTYGRYPDEALYYSVRINLSSLPSIKDPYYKRKEMLNILILYFFSSIYFLYHYL